MRHLLILFFALPFCLSGCVSAAWSGTKLAYDHYNLNQQITDYQVIHSAYNYMSQDPLLEKDSNINVSTLNNVLLLTGQVSSKEAKKHASTITRRIPHVRYVVNALAVEQPVSPAQQMRDSMITTKIKTHLFAKGNIDHSSIKIVTEDNVVYLMGIVRPKEGDIIANLAAKTSGVKKVVKLFEYIGIKRPVAR